MLNDVGRSGSLYSREFREQVSCDRSEPDYAHQVVMLVRGTDLSATLSSYLVEKIDRTGNIRVEQIHGFPVFMAMAFSRKLRSPAPKDRKKGLLRRVCSSVSAANPTQIGPRALLSFATLRAISSQDAISSTSIAVCQSAGRWSVSRFSRNQRAGLLRGGRRS